MVPLWCQVGAIFGHLRKKYRRIKKERSLERERERGRKHRKKKETKRETKREKERERERERRKDRDRHIKPSATHKRKHTRMGSAEGAKPHVEFGCKRSFALSRGFGV